ncbi:MAG: hypothetical protein KGL39_05255 [Patescibacteria group bacterium]|nr:hypothetical protein [Patescibacteria group bacterium]
MKKIGILALALELSGCATVSTLFGTTISPTQIIVAGNAFDAVEATATNYLSLPACVSGGTLVCRDATVAGKIVPLIRAGRQERSALEGYSNANAGAPVPVSLYDTLQSTIASLQSLFATYSIK